VEIFTFGNFVKKIRQSLSAAKDLARLAKRVATKHDFEGKSKVNSWKILDQGLKSVLAFTESLIFSGEKLEKLEIVQKLISRQDILHQLISWISAAIDFEASARDAQLRVKIGVVPEIDALRGKQAEIEILLSQCLPGETHFAKTKLFRKSILQSDNILATPGNSSDDEEDFLQLKLQYYRRLG